MSNDDIPQLERTAEGFRIRLRYGKGKQAKLVIPLTDEGAAKRRALALKELAGSVRSLPPAEAHVILTKACEARSEAVFAAILAAVQGELVTPHKKGAHLVTFAELASQWTSGELHRKYPDHVRKKRTADLDGQRLEILNETVGKILISSFTLEDADRAMSALPSHIAPATRRQYGQIIARLLKLAVYPCRLRDSSPIPPGWLPSSASKKAKGWLYPDEEALLLACSKVPLERRVLYGFLAREGMRISEALSLRWDDVDLVRGVIRLDANKTDSPRAWALSHSVVRALSNMRGSAEPDDRVFSPLPGDKNAEVFREDLARAQVTRAELFQNSSQRLAIRVHDLRGTFVTLSLANGKTEGWVQDRTGHASSQMINRYRREARTANEVGLGDLAPLHLALPEFWGPFEDDHFSAEKGKPREGESRGESIFMEEPSAGSISSMISGSSGWARTNDPRINSPLLCQLSYAGIWQPRRSC